MDAKEFLTYINVIRKRFWLILLLVLITVGVIVAMVITEPPVYRATVRLQVVTSDPLFSTVPTNEELIQARNDYADALSDPHVAWQTVGALELPVDALELLSKISVSMEDVFITVNVDASTPDLAFQIAESHVNNALTYYQNDRARPASVFLDFLQEQIKEETQILTDQNQNLLDFRLKNNILEPDSEAVAYQSMIRDLQLERDRTDIAATKAQASAQEFQAKADEAATQAQAAADRGATSSADYYGSLAEKYSTQAISFEASAAGSRAAVDQYDKLIASRRAELLELIRISEQYQSLTSLAKRTEGNYDFLESKANEAQLRESQARSVGFIEIVEPARYPDQQAPSKLPRLVMLGGLISLLAGVILAFMLEFLESLGSQEPPSVRDF